MNLIIKIIVSIFAILTLFFLMFFTFLDNGYSVDFFSKYKNTELGEYIIDENLKLSKLENHDNESLKVNKISIGNNIYYQEGNIRTEELDNQVSIYLEKGIYFFDINDISSLYSIYIDGYKVRNLGPGAFIINTTDSGKKSFFSISAKLSIDFLDLQSSETLTQVDLFPNIYLLAYPRYNGSVKNADLGKVKTSHILDMLSGSIYEYDTGLGQNILNVNLEKFLFLNDDNYNDFIPNVLDYIFKANQDKQNEFLQLTKNNFYGFTGEQYIIKYYKYFLNDEKKKVYYKNLISKELLYLLSTQTDNQSSIDKIVKYISTLKTLNEEEYINMMSYILYYYENIIYSQQNNPESIINITNLIQELKNKKHITYQPSLLQLRYIYTDYHNGYLSHFHENMNSFVNNYEKEMKLSVYNENHQIHNYFLYFLKNILVLDFEKVQDHNQMVILFKKYININEIFIDQGDNNIKKTALYDNAALIKVFIDIMRISFFQEGREDGLLVLQKPAKITNENYLILKENLEGLLHFHKEYLSLIIESSNRKDIILNNTYTTYNDELIEYFEALSDYNRYILNRSKIEINIPDAINENLLSKEKIISYLSQFTGADYQNAEIFLRNYTYCIHPDEINIIESESFCYEIKNFYVKGYKFDFLLTPSDNNKISYLNYVDDHNKPFDKNIEHIMDNIEEGLEKLYDNAEYEDKDKYDFSRFFIDKYVNVNTETIIEEAVVPDSPFIVPELGEESIPVIDLKQKLLTQNSPLEKIRDLLPITYKYINIVEENGEFIGHIFPISFNISILKDKRKENESGMFIGKYSFASNKHQFFESSIYIQKSFLIKDVYLFDEKPINIQGSYLLSDTESIISDIYSNITRTTNIYTSLSLKFDINDINISFIPDTNITQFVVSDLYIFNINIDGNMQVLEENLETFNGSYTQINTILQKLQ